MKRDSQTFFDAREQNNYSKDYFLYKKSIKLREEIEDLTHEFKSLKTKFPQSFEYQKFITLFKTQIINQVFEKPLPSFLLKFDDAINKIGFLKPKNQNPIKIENIQNFHNKNNEYSKNIENIQSVNNQICENLKKIENVQNNECKNNEYKENIQKIDSDIDDKNEIINDITKKTQNLQNLMKETDNPELDCTILYEDSLTCLQKPSNESKNFWTNQVKISQNPLKLLIFQRKSQFF